MGTGKACAYCGAPATTRDHIPPKALFAKPRPRLITVPSCRSCNLSGSKDDEYLRIMLSFRHDISEHPDVKAFSPDIFRSLGKPERAGLRKSILASVQEVPAHTPAGIYLGPVGTYNVDLKRLDAVVARIIAGLFLHTQGHRLADAYEAFSYAAAGLHGIKGEARNRLKRSADFALAGRHEAIGCNVFSYWMNNSDVNPNICVAVIAFYGRAIFIGGTAPRGRPAAPTP